MDTSEKCHVLIGCTGSVASVKLHEIVELLQKLVIEGKSMDIKVIATENAHNFIYKNLIPDNIVIYSDKDEWAAWRDGDLADPVLHIQLRRWADAMIIAPLDANTLAKIANGLCDNLLTCTVRAWDRHRPLLFCPAMNTHMWDHPITAKHIKQLKELGYIEVPVVAKRLACGDVGAGGMAEVNTIVNELAVVMGNYFALKD